ncbi:coiled-coil domain-containing protein 30 [Spea bombifrons]|uniref:coiled-coil domain-containing protein 30 n=1 Tax=Spea bombifrons TaxID=233779 RepID=UPI00234B03C1|nr:coiled-coil domain-containing protein 30 [Spea bombifrons]
MPKEGLQNQSFTLREYHWVFLKLRTGLGIMRRRWPFKAGGRWPTYDEELDKERRLRECAERDLEEAARRLQMSHDEIRRLTEDLLCKQQETSELELVLQKTQQERDEAGRELQAALENDSSELQKAKDYCARLDKEILALRNRVKSLDAERKKYMEQSETSPSVSTSSPSHRNESLQDHELLHKSCRLAIEERECLNQQLLHKLQKLQNELEETTERNEELESILGETQNRTKEQTEYSECEIDGLHKTIKNLEAELQKLRETEKGVSAMDGEGRGGLRTRADSQQIAESHAEKVKILERNLREEKQENERLAAELRNTQNALQAGKEELQASTVRVKSLQNDLRSLKNLEEERKSLRAENEQLRKEKKTQDGKILELAEECKRLEMRRGEQDLPSEALMAKEKICQQLEGKISDLENQIHTMSIQVSESKKKCEALQKQIHEGMEEKQKLWEETLQLRQETKNARQDLQSKRDENLRLKREMADMQDKMPRPQSCGDGAEEIVPKFLTGDSLIQQQYEEIRQLRQDLHRVQNVCGSAEKELRYERDKNLEIKKQHISLQQENTKISGELNHVKQKLASVTASCSGLEAELEKRQQKMKETELELLKRNQNSKLQSNWQERLEHEKTRTVLAEKMVSELQQQLRSSQHQLQLSQTHAAERKRLEEELKKVKENETKIRAQCQEEQLRRKVLDQSIEELKQTIKTLRYQETLLTENNSALKFKLNQQESLLRSFDDEKNTSAKERIYRESNNQKLSEDLLQAQQEKEELHKEYNKILKQLDEYIRKYNEKQLRHKAKLDRAKDVHFNELNQRDVRVKQLEMDIALCRSQAEKDQQWINRITAENDHLHLENRHMLQRINEQEAIERNHQWELLSLRNRAHILDEENKQLQECLLQLYNQAGSLDRVIKKIQALNSEEIRKLIPSECLLLRDTMLHLPVGSFSAAGLSNYSGIFLSGRNHEKTADPRSLSHSQVSEVGYLNGAPAGVNVTSPEQTPHPAPEDA